MLDDISGALNKRYPIKFTVAKLIFSRAEFAPVEAAVSAAILAVAAVSERRAVAPRRQRSDSAEKFIEFAMGADPNPLDDITLAITDCANV